MKHPLRKSLFFFSRPNYVFVLSLYKVPVQTFRTNGRLIVYILIVPVIESDHRHPICVPSDLIHCVYTHLDSTPYACLLFNVWVWFFFFFFSFHLFERVVIILTLTDCVVQRKEDRRWVPERISKFNMSVNTLVIRPETRILTKERIVSFTSTILLPLLTVTVNDFIE